MRKEQGGKNKEQGTKSKDLKIKEQRAKRKDFPKAIVIKLSISSLRGGTTKQSQSISKDIEIAS